MRRLMAAGRYARKGGPRGRALALTVAAGNRHALNDHDNAANVIVWDSDAAAGASK